MVLAKEANDSDVVYQVLLIDIIDILDSVPLFEKPGLVCDFLVGQGVNYGKNPHPSINSKSCLFAGSLLCQMV